MYVCPLADVHHGRPRGTGVEGCWMEWSSSALRNNKSCPRRGRRQGSLIERAWPTGKEPGRAEATIGLWLSPTHPGLAVSFPFSLLAAVSSPGLADISSSYRSMACPGTSSERIARRLRPMAKMLGLTVTLFGVEAWGESARVCTPFRRFFVLFTCHSFPFASVASRDSEAAVATPSQSEERSQGATGCWI